MTRIRALSLMFMTVAIGWSYFSTRPTPPPLPDIQKTHCGGIHAACVVGERQYNILLPKGDGPFPAMLFFHGSMQSGEAVISTPSLTFPLIEQGYALIAPSAKNVTYQGNKVGSGWIWEGERNGRDDYQFVRNVLSDVQRNFPIDLENIIVAGHSNGATFVWYLSCVGVDPRLSVFAPNGGTPTRGLRPRCSSSFPTFSLLHTHGASDPTVPVAGTQRAGGFSGWLGAREAVEGLAARARCQTEDHSAPKDVLTLRWTNCPAENEFEVRIMEGGHAIRSDWIETVLTWVEGLNAS